MAIVIREFGVAARHITGKFRRTTDVSAANTALTLSTDKGHPLRIVVVTVQYSAGAIHAGITVTLNSGRGAAWDTLLALGSADVDSTVFFPDGDLWIADDDTLDVLAPQGGVGNTSQIAIYLGVL